MNDYKAKIEAIVEDMCMHSQKAPGGTITVVYEGLSPDQATASLLKLLTEARIEELEYLLNYEPTNRALEFNYAWRPGKLYIKNRIAELKGEK